MSPIATMALSWQYTSLVGSLLDFRIPEALISIRMTIMGIMVIKWLLSKIENSQAISCKLPKWVQMTLWVANNNFQKVFASPEVAEILLHKHSIGNAPFGELKNRARERCAFVVRVDPSEGHRKYDENPGCFVLARARKSTD